MAAVAVGGLHKRIVRIFDVFRVLDDGLVQIADIAREYQLGRGFALGDPQLDAGRTQQMPHVHESHLDARGQLHTLCIVHTNKQFQGRFGILHRIHGFHRLCTGALPLAVFPLSFKFLNVRRVPQHDAAQLHCGVRGVDLSPEAVARQQRQLTGVVDMGMGDQHPVDLAGCHRDRLVLVDILALLHTAVDEEPLPGCLDQCAAAGDFVVRTQKRDLHKNTSGLFSALSIAYFKGTRRTNRAAFLGHCAESAKKFLYNLDKPPHSVINLDLYDVRSYFMSLQY